MGSVCKTGRCSGGRGNEEKCHASFPKSCDFIILLLFQDPQGNSNIAPAKRCRLALMKRPAYEPATNPPPQKRPPVEEEDATSIPLDEEEDLAGDEEEDLGINISLTDEEERLNLVSPLLTSKVTISVLNIACHWFLTQSVLISVNTYYPWLGCMSALAHMYVMITGNTCSLPPPPHMHTY